MDEEAEKLTINITGNTENAPEAEKTDRLEKLARSVCEQFALTEGQVGIVLLDDEEIININRRYLGHRETTDVISFDLSEPEGQICMEILINLQQAQRQADSRGHSVIAELALYLVHGLLHQLGFDDDSEENAKKMHDMEDKILQNEGYGNVYSKENNIKGVI